ncbi:VWA domain-containing protein [Cereibacter sphaeroides]|uniref:VWA domain-containing protein n=1 Tax=Cereibacter sphaeroides TaxID=1063 RepID=UPI0039909A37
MLDLAAPFFLLLLPLPFLARRLLPPHAAQEGALYLPEAFAAAARPTSAFARSERWEGALRAILWLALVLALAGPERLKAVPDLSASGREIVLTLDMSGSMLIEDFDIDGVQSTRLEAVKRVARSFVEERQGDRIGLVLFANRAYVAAPLTFDLAAVGRAIEEASIGITGRSTAIADGLGLALKRVTESAAASRVIVLLSDGQDNAHQIDARQVAGLAARHGVRIHTIALGPDDLETRPAARDAVDTATLRAIAEASGGRSYRVRGMEDLRAMAADLDRLEPNPAARPPVLVPEPLWPWPALVALGAALVLGLRRAGLAPWPRRTGRAA